MNPYDYSTAADYARLSGYHRTTIVEWIKQGKIKARNKTLKNKKKNHNRHWKIAHESFKRPAKKAVPMSGKIWTVTELYVLKCNIDAPLSALVNVIPSRDRNAICIMRCRIKNKKNKTSEA